MKIAQMRNLWLSGLLVTLLSLWSLPALAGVAKLPPTGPWDAATGKMAVPDYFSTANWAYSPPLTKFVDRLPGLGAANANANGQYLPVGVPDITTYPGSDYYEIELVEYSETMHSDLPPTRLRGYRQTNRGTDTTTCGTAPKLPCSSANLTVEPPLIPHYLGPVLVATKDRPVRIKFTNNLPTGAAGDLFIPVDTTFMGAGPGPAKSGGARGVGTPCASDATPLYGNPNPNACAEYTQNRATLHLHGGRTPWISDGTPHQWITPAAENTPYPKGVSVQDVPDMPKSDPLDGSQTFFYSNQQSARLMFYHDHAFGITRLNVYAGEAAGYLITDKWEQDLVTRGILPADQIPLVIQDRTFVDATPTAFTAYNPNTGAATPLTVPAVRVTDPTWNWGTGTADANGVRTPVTGDLWMPHVYMTNQNPYNPDLTGTNAFGRWFYGPWFFPPTLIDVGPQPNPYFDADCADPTLPAYANCKTPGQPPVIPGVEHPSSGMEAFMDTAVVNGTAFPVLEVDPKSYRFRILNAANDRGMNLSIYKADSTGVTPDIRRLDNATEIKMVPAAVPAPGVVWPPLWPVDGRLGGVPDPGICSQNLAGEWNCSNWGPKFIQIGTEAGFLPAPVVRDPQPVTYVTNPAAFWVGIVQDTGLALMPAERADVVVDFSAYAGQTLILYNDGPTAWPALDPRYDFFTDTPDMRDTGGYGAGGTYDAITRSWTGGHGPVAGFGPNTRTVMQIKVRAGAGTPFNKTALDAEFTNLAPATALNPVITVDAPKPGSAIPQISQIGKTLPLFQRAQEPIVALQAAYQNAYPDMLIPGTSTTWGGIRHSMLEHSLNFLTIEGLKANKATEPKALHDEMGASFDKIYGRMQSNLGMQIPNPTTNNANMIIYGYQDIPSETIINSTTGPVQVNAALLNNLADGTQIWNISHNGVDTHPIHFHIFDAQLINRIGWDGMLANPDPNELGWKDTIRISPLMDTIVALRPVAPLLPFGIPNSLRPLNPALPISSTMGFSTINWLTDAAFVPPVVNQLTDFGWEYVWHCHILSHEEMDMMRPIVLLVNTALPAAPTAVAVSAAAVVTWTDPTPAPAPGTLPAPANQLQNEIGFRIERCTAADCSLNSASWVQIGKAPANSASYRDATATPSILTNYRVIAYNQSGSTYSAGASAVIGSLVRPTITIDTNPAATLNYSFGSPIAIDAAALATLPATLSKVDYYVNGGLYGSSAAAPFSVTIANASPGTLLVTARATDSDGMVSLPSNTLTISVVQAAAPAGISVPSGSTTGTYTVSWPASTSAGATYTLQESTTPAFLTTTTVTSGSAATSALISGKADSTIFYYRVMTVATTGNSVWTVGANGCAVSYPTIAPLSITVPPASSTGTYTISWGTSSTPGATYTLEESTSASFSSGTTVVVASGLAVTSRVISGKSNGTFYYRVKAVATGYSTFPWTTGANGCAVTMLPVITAPAGGANLTGGIPATITATVPLLAGSTVTSVEFYVDGVIAGTSAAAPYVVTWTPGTTGSHNLTVIAVYSNNSTGTVSSFMSPVVTVTVAGVPPTITLDSPLSGAVIDLGTPTVITSTPSVVGPTLIAVVFYENGTFLNWAAPGATSISWTPTVAGTRTLTAFAYYNNLAVPAASAGTPVTINGTVIAPASISVPGISTGAYTVSWTAAAPATAGATYTLEESTTAGFTAGTTTVVTSGLSATSAAISGKAVGTYYYRVKGVKAPMTDSAWVNGAQGSSVVPPAPAIVTAAGVFRNGQWYLDMNGNSTLDPGVDILSNFGAAGDIPVTGIWNGTGTTKIGVFKNGVWTLDMNGNGTLDPGTDVVYSFGITGDIPVTGDWNGSGTTRIGVFKNGQWHLDLNGNGIFDPATDVIRNFGLAGDIPVTGDWNGTGITKIGVFRNGQWYLDMNGNGIFDPATDVIRNFGLAGDVPVTGDWNSTGTTKIGVFRNGQWLLDMNGNGVWDPGTDVIRNFGLPGDVPVTVNGMIVAPASITIPASGAAGAYTVSWSAAAAAPAGTTYTLEESTTAGFTAGTTTVVTSGLPALSAAITGKAVGTYYYRVKAVKAPLADSIWVNGANGCSVLPAVIATKTGVFRGSQWYLDMNGNGVWDPATDLIRNFGITGDVPVTGIWNGAGATKSGVFRNGEWYLDMNGNGAFDPGIDVIRTFGLAGDVPVTGNWNGSGVTNIGVFRNGEWYLDTNGSGVFDPGIDAVHVFGLAGDIPVTGDWSGTGTTKIGVFRNGQWFLDMNGNGVFDAGTDVIHNFGLAGDIPVTGDWNGSGTTRIGVYRNGQWFLDMNGNGVWDPGIDALVNFGIPGDVPVTGKW